MATKAQPKRPQPKQQLRSCDDGSLQSRKNSRAKSATTPRYHCIGRPPRPGRVCRVRSEQAGGNNGLTFVILDIDGRNVVNMSYAAAQNLALIQQNPFGVVLLSSGQIKTFTIGWPSPLRYERELKLRLPLMKRASLRFSPMSSMAASEADRGARRLCLSSGKLLATARPQALTGQDRISP